VFLQLLLTDGIIEPVVGTRLARRDCSLGKLTTAADGKIGWGSEHTHDRRGGEDERREGNHDDGRGMSVNFPNSWRRFESSTEETKKSAPSRLYILPLP
jgi:hypothetical protein